MKKQFASSRSAARASKNVRYASGRKHARGLKAEELEELFDSSSDDIDKRIDWSKAQRPGREIQRMNVDFPDDLVFPLIY